VTVVAGATDIVGMVEIAERLGVQRTTVERWRQRYDNFPRPSIVVSGTPIWTWPAVEAWAKFSGRIQTTKRTAPPVADEPVPAHDHEWTRSSTGLVVCQHCRALKR
jgi:hypothetical protein